MTRHGLPHFVRLTLTTIALSTWAIAVGGCSSGSQSSSNLPATSGGATTQSTARRTQGTAVSPVDPNLTLPPGFSAAVIANVPGARELIVSENGDLLVGTQSDRIAIVTNADSSTAPGAAKTFMTMSDSPAAGISFGPYGALYIGTQYAVWKVHYTPGDQSESNPQRIATLRTGGIPPNSGGDIHHTTSVIALWNNVYAAVGSSCNACTEIDAGRAAIISMGLNGENPTVYAKNIRNAMAMAINPRTYFVWAGGAGQDELPSGHPYEYFDAITENPAGSSWGWPECEENHVAYTAGANCRGEISPHVELPAYSTIIGAVFYPLKPTGPYAFPASYRGNLFLSVHGSWHTNSAGGAMVGPQVDYVPMSSTGWDAATPPNWGNPYAQFSQFFGGFEVPGTTDYRGRPAGIGVGPNGSLFVSDDKTGNIYRIRPTTPST